MERLLTTEEVSDLLRIEPVTVRRLVTRGDLVAYRIAGEYRFTPSDVTNFVQSQRVPPVGVVPSPKDPRAKFTHRAGTVLSMANEEAYRYNHDGVGPEHVLLGLMDEGQGVAALALSQMGVRPDVVRAAIEKLHPAGDQPAGEREIAEAEEQSNGEIGMTEAGKASIELAVQEARGLGHRFIGTEHLLLGLLRQEDELACKVLRDSGVALGPARAMVKQLLAEMQPAGTPRPTPAANTPAGAAPPQPAPPQDSD
jgi:excisionase family DNA binding protein